MKTYLFILLVAGVALNPAALAQEPAATSSPRATMKAVVYHEYGSPAVLRLEEIEKPVPNDNQLLVRVRAASVNPFDWHYMEGTPYVIRLLDAGLLKPKLNRLGVDYAGIVEAVGKNVTQFKPGDEVFGGKTGAFAEYVCVTADRAVVHKPANITFEQAATVGIAATTALQGLRDNGQLRAGQKVLINGASGGVGTFAVQIAKSLGANVTGVCSGRNVDMVRALGADHVIDYTREDFTQGAERYDVIIDNVGNRTIWKYLRVLNPLGHYVLIGGGGSDEQGLFGPLVGPFRVMLVAPFVSQKMSMLLANMNQKDFNILADLMQKGEVKPVIDRRYKLTEIAEAVAYLEEGHARGKVVIAVEDKNEALTRAGHQRGSDRTAPSPLLIAFELIGVILAVIILPIVIAFVLNRRFQRRHPGKRGYRWGYYFSIQAFLFALALAGLLQVGSALVLLAGVIYALLAWFFAQRKRWAWIALTVLSFNPIAWLINLFYLWRRWTEDAARAAA